MYFYDWKYCIVFFSLKIFCGEKGSASIELVNMAQVEGCYSCPDSCCL